MRVAFYGATEGVTGSNCFVETDGGTKFVVDCGLFQGDDQTEEHNWDKFPYDPATIDFALITHSHIDHMGRLPKLAKDGFRGCVYSTEPVAGFAEIFLQDTRKILQNEAERKGKEELFSDRDIASIMGRFKTHKYHETFQPAEDVKVTLYDAGHILGSSFILVEADGKKIIFSGDLGNPPVPLLRNTDKLPEVDYVVMESTYGDRLHKKSGERPNELESVVKSTISAGGTLLMPSFAMERTQEILYELNELTNKGRLDNIPVYMDSPLAIRATEVYKRYTDYFDKDANDIFAKDNDLFHFPGLKLIESSEESKALDREVGPKVIIAGSGMSNGGRIVFHEKRFLPEPSTTLAIVGFQVSGTLGRQLKDGNKEVKIMGEIVQVRAKVHEISSYSAHADQNKLIDWVSNPDSNIKKIFLVHGEKEAKEVLKSKITERTGLDSTIPETGDLEEL